MTMRDTYSHDDIARLFVAASANRDCELGTVAVQAARAAGVASQDVAPAIAASLQRLDPRVAVAIGRLGDVELLARLCAEAGWEVRADAATALGCIGGERAREALLKASHDPDNWVEICADRALSTLPDSQPFENPGPLTPRGRTIAALLLERPSEIAIGEAARLFGSWVPHLARGAQQAIVQAGEPGRAVLFEALADTTCLTPRAVTFLGELEDTRALVPLLRSLAGLRPPYPRGPFYIPFQQMYADILPSLARRAGRDAVPSIIDAVVAAVECDAAPHILRLLGRTLEAVAPDSIDALALAFATTPSLRRRGGALVGRIAGILALPGFVADLQHVHRGVRANAAEGLVAIGNPAVQPLLNHLGATISHELRSDIERILRRIDTIRRRVERESAADDGSTKHDVSIGKRARTFHEEVARQEDTTFGSQLMAQESSGPATTMLPYPVRNDVQFSACAPLSSAPGDRFMLAIWVYRPPANVRALTREQHLGREKPVKLEAAERPSEAVEMSVSVSVPDYRVEGVTGTIYWSSPGIGGPALALGYCAFPIEVPGDATPGTSYGHAEFRIGSSWIATTIFALQVGESDRTSDDVTASVSRVRHAFASQSAP